MRVLTWTVCLLLAAATLRAEVDEARYEAAAQQGIERVYNLEFEEAERDFRSMIAMAPERPAGHFMLAMVTWWRILIDIDDERYDDTFLEDLDRVVAMCDSILEIDDRDVGAIFFKGGAMGFEGRLRFHRNDYLAAADAGRRALPLVQIAMELAPENNDILLGSGIYNYYADVIPREYPFLKPLLLLVPAGDRQKGLEQLTRAAEHGRYASIEASYFLMQVYFFYEHDYGKALDIARTLHQRFPNNMQFHRYLGRCYVALSAWDSAGVVFGEIARRAEAGQRGYTATIEREGQYYLGLQELHRQQYDAALQHLYRCDELSRTLDLSGPSGFMVNANLKIGTIYDLQGKRDLAIQQYRKVLEMDEYRDSHEQAERYLTQPYRD